MHGFTPPQIYVQPPTSSEINYEREASVAQLRAPSIDQPGTDSPSPRSISVAAAHRKSVQWAPEDDVAPLQPVASVSEEGSRRDHSRHQHDSPQHHHHRHHHHDRTHDTPHGTDDASSRDQNPDSGHRRRHHRSKNHQQEQEHDLNRDNSLLDHPRRDRDPSPTGSDATVDLPPRFDDTGRKRSVAGEDPLADRFEGVLGGWVDGIFGGGRKRG